MKLRMIALAVAFSAAALPALAHDGHAPAKVADAVAYAPSPLPDRIVLTWDSDPATTQTVTWRTDTSIQQAVAELAPAQDGPYFFMEAGRHPAETTLFESNLGAAHYHTVRFTGLQPKTRYAYRVGDGVNWSEWIQFTTAASAPEPFSFVYFGDSQNELKAHWSRVVREAYRDAPKAAFFLHAGDLINRANNDGEWGEWFYAGSHIHRMTPCVATPGNHEYQSGKLSAHWKPTFAFPTNGPSGLEETVYWFDYQGLRVISLNSNERHEEQARWVAEVLEDNPSRWTIVTYHHPMYSSGKGRDNPHLRALWQPVFDKYRVDLVLQGHDHTYSRTDLVTAENLATGVRERSDQGGTVYVVSVSGPKMYALERQPFVRRAAEDTQLYQVLHVGQDELRYEARTAIGTLYDAFTLRKRDGAPNELVEQVPDEPERRRGY